MQYILIKTFRKKIVFKKVFRRTAAVIVFLCSSNFDKRTTQFICYFLSVQDSHNPHSYHYYFLFIYLQNHRLMNPLTPQVFVHQLGTTNKILPRNYQCKSQLIVYLQPERYKKIGTNMFTNYFFSRAEILLSIITYRLGTTWITAKNQQTTYEKKFMPYWEVMVRTNNVFSTQT